MQLEKAGILYSGRCTRGYLLQKSCMLSREKAPVRVLHITYMFIDSLRMNKKMTIISPKPLNYFPFTHPVFCAGRSLVVPGAQ